MAFNQVDRMLSPEGKQKAFDYAKRMVKSIEKNPNEFFYMVNDPSFPRRLRAVPYPVDWIFKYGESKSNDVDSAVAIVGTRRCTKEALANTRSITSILVDNSFTTISGLAHGIDTEVHKVTLDRKGRTFAVLGTGINRIYPKNNTKLLEDILTSGGSVFTEYLPDSNGNRTSFIMRNRIIAALSDSIIAVEGEATGGTAHTIRFGAELGKKLIGVESTRNVSLNALIKECGGRIFSVSKIDKLVEFLRG